MRLVWVDLTAGAVRVEAIDADTERRFIGGRGLGAKLLADHLIAPHAPYDPRNPLIFTVGPFTGTLWPTGARYHVTFLSPLTGIYGYANAGGHFGAALRRTGYDGIVITGQADDPVYLQVTPAGVEVLPAGHIWGLGTDATRAQLAAEGARIACIGPAGERGVRFAAIINDGGRAAARCGGGAVMGAKRLKAIVVQGRADVELPAAFLEAARSAYNRVRDHPRVSGLREWGTVNLIAIKNQTGDLPARNHQEGQVPWVDRVDAEAIARYTVRTKGCFACPIQCGRVTRVDNGPYACTLEGPEYETTDALGPMCWINDPEALIYANARCNDLGLDTISTGATIAFAMECHERGLLAAADLSLEWGDEATLLGLIHRIAYREGIGDLLAEGTRRAALAIGGAAPRYAMHVKGMELPRQEPRVAKGFGLGHATSNRGADHLYALPTIDLAGLLDVATRVFPSEVIPALMETDNEQYKPDMIRFTEHVCALSDALGVCKFSTAETYALFPEDLAIGLSALWERDVSVDELLMAGERIVNLERMINVRLGLSRKDDRLPERFTTEPLAVHAYTCDETGEGTVRSKEPVHFGRITDFDAMLDRYYSLRGWDHQGIPTSQTLNRLGLA